MQLFLVTFELSPNQIKRANRTTPDKCPLSGNDACDDVSNPFHTAAYRLPDGATTHGVKQWLEYEGHTVIRVEIAALY